MKEGRVVGSRKVEVKISMRGSMVRLIFALILMTHHTACFRYELRPEAKKALTVAENERALHHDDAFCALVYDATKTGVFTRSPMLITYLGECNEYGLGGWSQNLDEAKELYIESASCGDTRAIGHLTRLAQAPPAIECSRGERFFPCWSGAGCGIKQEITPVGYILGGPFLVVGGVVLAVGAILALPICAITTPFHNNRCM